jgi:sugar phosphate permease
VGLLFLGLPLLLMVVASLVVPRLVKTYLGLQKTITVATFGLIVVSGLIAMPQLGRSSIYSFSILTALLIIFQTMQHQPNQVRVKLIAGYYTTNGSGIVTGASRTFWALGQAVAPVVCLSGYVSFGTWFPWMLLSIVMSLLLLLYVQQRVRFSPDILPLP